MKLNLRKITITLAAVMMAEGLFAQADSLVNLPNLLLPRFTTSLVKLKSGDSRRAVLNYNLVDQEMVFMQRDQFYVLDDPQLIDTIYMANRTFVPFEKGFYEVAFRGKVTLYIQHKAYAESMGVPTAYGARSQTTSYNYVKTIYGANGAINLRFPNEYQIVNDTGYWVLRNGIMSYFTNKNQFLKIFPAQAKELKQYLNRNKVDFKDYMAVTRLVEYCNTML